MTPQQVRALDLSADCEPTPNNVLRVASQVGEEVARWAFTQWELRRRARAKFALADEMLFDRDGLEMATHERVAGYHASRFPVDEKVVDLACGLGGDLIALARRGPAVGYETDPVRAYYARHNLAVHGLVAEVVTGAADPVGLDWECAFLDPQRRGTDGYGEPDPRSLPEHLKTVCVKLGTGLDIGQVVREVFPRVEAVSFGGECRELLSWKGRAPGVFALHVECGEELPADPYPPVVLEPAQYLFHADPAVIKARCLGTLCSRLGLLALGDSDGYLTGPDAVDSPWLRAYRVAYHGAADRKRTQAALMELGSWVAEVKTRGAREAAEKIRAQFKPGGHHPLVLAVWPVGKSLRHTLVERAPAP
jgi:hypothetical protein